MPATPIIRALKKPVPIEVQEFQVGKMPWPMGVSQKPNGQYYVQNILHDSQILIKPGDYINVTDKTGHDVYPIDRDTFERTYDVMSRYF